MQVACCSVGTLDRLGFEAGSHATASARSPADEIMRFLCARTGKGIRYVRPRCSA